MKWFWILAIVVAALIIVWKVREGFEVGIIDTYRKPIEDEVYRSRNPGLVD